MFSSQALITYEYADKVFNKTIDVKDAISLLKKQFPDTSEATHSTNIKNYACMLEGKKYTWNSTIEITTLFLEKIKENYGINALSNALKAVKENVKFLYSCQSSKSTGLRDVCKKIASDNNIQIDFDDSIFDGVAIRTKSVDSCWLVGASYGNIDQTDYFIENGIWKNGYTDKYLNKVNQVKVGDKIAIKSTFTQKHNLPFNVNGNTVSAMKIIVTGTVVKNIGDGRTLEVEWNEKYIEPKLWYFYTFRQTIQEIKRKADDWKPNALLDFIFSNTTQPYHKFLQDPYWNDLYPSSDDIPVDEEQRYTKESFLNEVYMSSNDYDKLRLLLETKQNIILQGAPGVGKTYAAKRLAYSMLGEKDETKIKTVQFHQNYSYEDFVMGYRPTETGFELRKGVFYEFCKQAELDPDNKYFFLIDEINRGNLSSIFGELLMLIEHSYRGVPITLSYEKTTSFSVPKNLYIIGMMNTADRSLAIIDYALRRRFSFFTMNPGFKSTGFTKYQQDIADKAFDNVITTIIALNEIIKTDATLGSGFCIGHSYFICTPETFNYEWLSNVIEYDLIPILEEYWFDEGHKSIDWANKLRNSLNGN